MSTDKTPVTCAVRVAKEEWPYVTMCGGTTLAIVPEEIANTLEDLGWSFAWDALKEVPMCSRHYNQVQEALTP